MIADKIADWLAEKDIVHAFGIIGAGNLSLWDAIARKGATEIVCCHHEQAAAIAAGFYFRANGRLAAVLVTTGAGQANAITGIISNFMDSTPVIVLSGNEPARFMASPSRVLGVQGFDVTKMVKDYTKFSARPRNWHGAFMALEEAHKQALAPRQGPVWIDFGRDVQCQSQ